MKLHVPFRFFIRYVAVFLAILVIILLFSATHRNLSTDYDYVIPVEEPPPTCPEVVLPADENSESPSRDWLLRAICECPRATASLARGLLDARGQVVQSACDSEATARGANQSVVSYTFYGRVTSDFFQGIEHNAVKVAQMYPGYVMRVYHDQDVAADAAAAQALCALWCEHDHLDFCDARHLPYDLCDQQHLNPRLWRFFVLGDPLVSRFLIRDIDSDIMQREADSVQEWTASGKTWHIMRDHPLHSNFILAGMWSGTNSNMTQTTSLRKMFIEEGNSTNYGLDQHLLQKILWPIIQNDMVSHDSYLCSHFVGTSPYPSQRPPDKEFIGNKFPWKGYKMFSLHSECPVECRPKDHQDWAYC